MTKDELIKSVYYSVIAKINIELSKFPLTYTAIFRNIEKISYIANSIISCDNYYVSQLLSRSLLEHHIVGYYLFIKLNTEQTDEVGESYYHYYIHSEFFKQENYNNKVQSLLVNEKIITNALYFKDKYPELFAQIAEKDISEIHRIAKQFDIREISKFLINEISNSKEFKNLHITMLDFLRKYNFLSSYIHAGPSSDNQTFKSHHFNQQKEIIADNTEWAKTIQNTSKSNFLLALCKEYPNLLEEYEKINSSKNK